MTMALEEQRLYVYVLEASNRLLSYNGDPRDGWVLRTADGTLVETYTCVRKPDSVRMAAERMKAFWRVARKRSELRIRNKNGEFALARTYPRSADPRRSKG